MLNSFIALYSLRILQVPFYALSLLLLQVITTAPLYAGALSSFEQNAAQSKSAPQKKKSNSDDDDDDISFWGELVLGIVTAPLYDTPDASGVEPEALSDKESDIAPWDEPNDLPAPAPLYKLSDSAFVMGGVNSWARVAPGWDEYTGLDVNRKESGEPQLAFMRIDGGYQAVEGDVNAYDYQIELGYGPVGVQYNKTHYYESDTDDKMQLSRLYGLYRMSLFTEFELDLGLGRLTVDGSENNSYWYVTTPVKIHVDSGWGVEFRPGLSDNITEWDLALLKSWQYFSLKAGYRWLSAGDASLDGPYLGFALHY